MPACKPGLLEGTLRLILIMGIPRYDDTSTFAFTMCIHVSHSRADAQRPRKSGIVLLLPGSIELLSCGARICTIGLLSLWLQTRRAFENSLILVWALNSQ